jgi:hypothetical protein
MSLIAQTKYSAPLTPNVAKHLIEHLPCITEIPGSKLGPETGYTDCGFSWLSSVSPRESGIVPYTGHTRLLLYPFQVNIH